jgi:hypothetical protein
MGTEHRRAPNGSAPIKSIFHDRRSSSRPCCGVTENCRGSRATEYERDAAIVIAMPSVPGILLGALLFIVPPTQAQSNNNWVDENAIRRGDEIAAYCNQNHKYDLAAQAACQEQGGRGLIGDRFALLGFFYHSFVIDARSLEILVRNNPNLPREVIVASSNTIKASLKGLRVMQDQTFLGIERICVIVRGNCALADRLYREWVPKLPAQAIVR